MAEIEEASLVKLGALADLARACKQLGSQQRASGASAQVAFPQRLGLLSVGIRELT